MKLSKTNNLAVTHPELVKEWHPIKNGDLTPDQVVFGSHRSVWWKCSKNPQHKDWRTAIHNRTRPKKAGCPTCGHKKSVESFKRNRLAKKMVQGQKSIKDFK